MHKLFFPSVLFLSAGGLTAGEQIEPVTPASLAGWSFTGSDSAPNPGDEHLSLPPNAQLARSFVTTELAVKLVTRPVFSAEPANWPILEIGQSALIFRRKGNDGELALAWDENAPVSLPFTIELDDDGHSAEPLTLLFTRRGAVTVRLNGQSLTVPAAPLSGAPVQVVISAGASDPWTLESMAVVLTTAENPPDAPVIPAEPGASAGPEALLARRRLVAAGLIPEFSFTLPSDLTAPSEPPGMAEKRAPNALEVFTPPSVRQGRADVIRAEAAGKQPQ
jgi:hypothetical protein